MHWRDLNTTWHRWSSSVVVFTHKCSWTRQVLQVQYGLSIKEIVRLKFNYVIIYSPVCHSKPVWLSPVEHKRRLRYKQNDNHYSLSLYKRRTQWKWMVTEVLTFFLTSSFEQVIQIYRPIFGQYSLSLHTDNIYTCFLSKLHYKKSVHRWFSLPKIRLNQKIQPVSFYITKKKKII